jgi:peptide chain release factor 3
VEQKLGLTTVPMSFPIGMGYDFQGIYNLWSNTVRLFDDESKTTISHSSIFKDLNDDALELAIGNNAKATLEEELELVREVYPNFEREAYLNGQQHPVFFGSALNNFGVQELLDCFVEIAPPPQPKNSEERSIAPDEEAFSGFVFKIHANMDPKHRDRLAFIKIVSGSFARNVPYLHVRQNKKLKFSSPNAFFADKKQIVDISYPGDIVGLHDTGNFKIGDTLTSGEKVHFRGIPSFSPEHFRYINNADPMKAKQLNKGIDQLMDEGVAQLFSLELNGRKIVGTVGALQFDVIQYRLEHEYGASCTYENLNVHKACWVEVNEGGDADFTGFKQTKSKFLARDKQGQLIFLADSAFTLQMTQSKYPGISFHATSEF